MSRNNVGIKAGSALLTDGTGRMNMEFVQGVCHDTAMLKRQGHRVFIVTSGAIASVPDKTMSENLRSSIGQPKLIGLYIFFLETVYGLKVSQLLPSYHDLAENAPVFPNVFREALEHPKVVPVINYPDSLDNREVEALHEFTDNDKLFYHCCLSVKADVAIIATKNGFRDSQGEFFYEATTKDEKFLLGCCHASSGLGHGSDGMRTKIEVLCALARQGIRAVLVPGGEENFVTRAFNAEKDFGLTILTK